MTDRTWLPHIPTLIDKKVIKEIESKFKIEMEITSSHKTRMKNDLQYQMLLFYFIKESNLFKFEIREHIEKVDYMALRNR